MKNVTNSKIKMRHHNAYDTYQYEMANEFGAHYDNEVNAHTKEYVNKLTNTKAKKPVKKAKKKTSK